MNSNSPPYFEGAIRNIIEIIPRQKYTKVYTGLCKFTEDIEILEQPYWSDEDFWVKIKFLHKETSDYDKMMSLGDMGVIPYTSTYWNSQNYLIHYVEPKKKVKVYRWLYKDDFGQCKVTQRYYRDSENIPIKPIIRIDELWKEIEE